MLLCAAAQADTRASKARVDQEIRISIGAENIEIEYDTVLNRPAAFLEVVRMDVDQDGKMSPGEQVRYFTSLGRTLGGGLELSVNGRPATLKPVGKVKLTMPFTKTYRFTVPHPENWADGAEIELHNDNYLSLPGTVKITVDPGDSSDITHKRIAGEALGDSGAADLSETQQRDIVIRYRKGTGKSVTDATPQTVLKDQIAAPPPTARRIWIMILSGLGALATAAFIGPRKRPVIACLTLLCAAAAIYAISAGDRRITIDDEQATEIFRGLHEGVYRAFNARSEDEIYDTLAMSLEGELLDKVYNEVHHAVAMRQKQQMSFRIRRIKAISTEILPATGNAFKVRCRWRVYGTVTHLAHSHARFNEYQATYTVRRRGSAWRIADSRIRRHKRISAGQS